MWDESLMKWSEFCLVMFHLEKKKWGKKRKKKNKNIKE
jgi:hypothetical protein